MAVPKEDDEAKALANWLRLNNYKSSHIWNESGQSWTRNIIIMMKKKKAMWVSKGFPDYCICLKRKSLLFIELKRQRPIWKSGKLLKSPSKIMQEQLEWQSELNNVDNVACEICYWADDAIKTILKYEND